MDLREILEINAERNEAWANPSHRFTLSDRAVEFAEEAGEVCGEVKKLNRIRCGMVGTKGNTEESVKSALADEIGDAFITLALLAEEAGIDLELAIRTKFNKVSMKHGFPHRM